MPGNIIKNFFKRNKDKAQFIGAGPGRKLNASTSDASSSKSVSKKTDAYVPPKRNDLTAEARTAADAALARVQAKNHDRGSFNTSIAAIRRQVKRELDAEKEASLGKDTTSPNTSTEVKAESNDKLAVQGVFFRCPLVSDEVLPQHEWKAKIRSFLYEQLEDERALTASLIIHNCNLKDKAELCIETLSKYLENILNSPDEEKFRKIRLSNRIFCDRVRGVEGGYDFLIGAGFEEQTIDGEPFLIFTCDSLDHLPELLDALKSSEKICLELDRNIGVLLPSQARKFELPSDFYRMSPEDLKREQKLRTEALESAQQLKTKAMREKEELRTLNMYKYSLIRIRFPDGVFLQGTFSVYDKLGDIFEFVRSCLNDESFDFSLVMPSGPKMTAENTEKTLYDLRLVPSILLTFVHSQPNEMGNYLKEELLMLIQEI